MRYHITLFKESHGYAAQILDTLEDDRVVLFRHFKSKIEAELQTEVWRKNPKFNQ